MTFVARLARVSESELERVRRVYEARDRRVPRDRYAPSSLAVALSIEGQGRAARDALLRAGAWPLTGKAILEIGCGSGRWLADFAAWGADPARLAGIDAIEKRVEDARARAPGADVRVGDAAALPWPDAAFDVVLQSTVMSSVLDPAVRQRIAAEMARVLKPDGVVLWYDFFYDNPWNPDVRGVRAAELRRLFPGFAADLRRVTLAPPLARLVAPISLPLARLLSRLRVLNTHYLAVLRRPG